MSETTIRRMEQRLRPKSGERIDRSRTIHFTFDGRVFTAHPGDTIGSALAAAEVSTISRSFKYHRPRGLMCGAGHCPNCLVKVGDEPNVRACTVPVEAGMQVTSQNRWPSLERDLMSFTALTSKVTPVGFYYKTFIRPQSLWPVYEKFLRHMAGLGEIDLDASVPEGFFKQYLHADLVVVGGGPAGMAAAFEAAEAGAEVLLLEEQPSLGGHTAYSGDLTVKADITELESALNSHERVSVHTDTVVLGVWEDQWLSAVSGKVLSKIRGRALLFATGSIEQPLLFDNNDLPGVMLAGAVQRLHHLYGVAPGVQAVVVTTDDWGWRTAADMLDAGIELAAVVDTRRRQEHALVEIVAGYGTSIYWEHTILAAKGRRRVNGAVIGPVSRLGGPDDTSRIDIPCDLVVVSGGTAPDNGLLYQAGALIRHQPDRDTFLPETLPPAVFAAGRVAGTHGTTSEIADGRREGRAAAVFLGLSPSSIEPDQVLAPASVGPKPEELLPSHKAKSKRFVCFCEDVSDNDLEMAIAEGYDSVELLKRYSTISMGPCQGKICSVNAIRLCARANEQSIEATGTTVSRPPATPVSLAALAGQHMEPVRHTPVHQWHLSHGAKMMVAGLWLRPEHYGDPNAEVRAVRETAGLIDVSTLGKLRLTGPGVPDLLERITVNRWQKLAIGRTRYDLMCNDEGILIDDGVTARLGETEWLTTTSSGGANAIYEWIQWWVQSGWGDGVHVTNVTDTWAAFNLAGPNSRAILERLSSGELSNEAFPYMGIREMSVAGVPCRLMRLGFTGELSYEIHAPSAYGFALWSAIMEAGDSFGIRPFGVEAQRILRLEKAHIIVGQDTDALTDPLSAAAGWAVKLDKADFLGKRALSRIRSEGPSQRLVGFKMVDSDIVVEEGLQIVQRDESAPIGLGIIGWVTSCRYSPTLSEAIGLCWLPSEMADQPGARFTIRREGRLLEATVFHGPFYDPKGERLRI